MLRVLSVYFPFTKATLKSEYFAYKSRFFLWALANCVSFLAQLFLWKAIYENSASLVINGYSFCEMVEYLGIAKIVECISFASIERKVSKGIRDGEIANSLIKPINYRTELLFCSFGQVIGSSCLFLPVYLISFAVFCLSNGVNVYISFKNVIFSIIYVSMAFIINYYISLIFSSIIFKTIKHEGIYQLKKTLIGFLAGSLFPISFYPKVLRESLTFFPFVYLRYYPVRVMQGKMETREIIIYLIIGCFWIVLLGVIASYLWKKMLKKLMVFGG